MSSPRKNDIGGLQPFFNQASALKRLTREQEQALAVRCTKGDRAAMDKLVSHNILFAVNQAKRHVRPGAELDDLIQESICGMYLAAEKFQPVGVKFISYATWYIRTACQRYAVTEGATIARPYKVIQTSLSIKKFRSSGGDINATPAEIRKALSLSETQCTDLEITNAINSMLPTTSLDESLSPTGDPNSSTRLDMLVDPKPFNQPSLTAAARRSLDRALKGLTEREQYCVQRYYLDEKVPLPPHKMSPTKNINLGFSLEEIGDEIGISRERVRQILNEVKGKLRESSGPELRQALDNLLAE